MNFQINLNTPCGGRSVPEHLVDKQCAFDDHGWRCNLYGTISNNTNGEGPWWCSQHYWELNRLGVGKGVTPEQHAEWIEDSKTLLKAKDTSPPKAPAATTESATVSGQWEGRLAAPGPTGEVVDEDTGEIVQAQSQVVQGDEDGSLQAVFDAVPAIAPEHATDGGESVDDIEPF
jgi:hypothetical protein